MKLSNNINFMLLKKKTYLNNNAFLSNCFSKLYYKFINFQFSNSKSINYHNTKHTNQNKLINLRSGQVFITQTKPNKLLNKELTGQENSPVLDDKSKKVNKYRIQALNKPIWRNNAFYKSVKIKRAIEDELYGPPESFELRDREDLIRFYKKDMDNKQFVKLNEKWQNKLYKRRLMKANTKYNYDNFDKSPPEKEAFYAHNLDKDITLPPKDSNMFAVIMFQGRQYKITKDDLVIFDKTPFKSGDSFIIDKVLMIGSTDYTSIGRPFINSAKVLVSVEECSKTEKVIVFKKKRRKGYQKNMGHRQEVTLVRVNKIVHNPEDEVLDNYKSIV